MDLLDIHAIRRLRREYQPTIGVYFLFDRNSLVYIGQSTHVELRIADHRRRRAIFSWTHSVVIPCENQIQALRLEAAYIRRYYPKGNKACPYLPDTIHPEIKSETPTAPVEKRRQERENWHRRYGTPPTL